MIGFATGTAVVHAALLLAALRRLRRALLAHRARARILGTASRRLPLVLASVRARLAARRPGRDADALPDVVEAITDALASGAPTADALEAAAAGAPDSLAEAVVAVAAGVRRGHPLVESLDRWAVDNPTDGASLVAAAVAIASSTGGDPALGLAGVASTLRERRSVAREVRALASQARASAAVIAVAPVAFAVLTAGLGGGAGPFLLASPLGLACLGSGLALDLAGWRWMRRITESVR